MSGLLNSHRPCWRAQSRSASGVSPSKGGGPHVRQVERGERPQLVGGQRLGRREVERGGPRVGGEARPAPAAGRPATCPTPCRWPPRRPGRRAPARRPAPGGSTGRATPRSAKAVAHRWRAPTPARRRRTRPGPAGARRGAAVRRRRRSRVARPRRTPPSTPASSRTARPRRRSPDRTGARLGADRARTDAATRPPRRPSSARHRAFAHPTVRPRSLRAHRTLATARRPVRAHRTR